MLPKISTHVKSYDNQTKWMYFLIENNDVLRKIEIKSALTLKKNLKTKIKYYNDESTDFHDKEMPKAGSNHTFLGVITIEPSLRNDENYYPQVFLK